MSLSLRLGRTMSLYLSHIMTKIKQKRTPTEIQIRRQSKSIFKVLAYNQTINSYQNLVGLARQELFSVDLPSGLHGRQEWRGHKATCHCPPSTPWWQPAWSWPCWWPPPCPTPTHRSLLAPLSSWTSWLFPRLHVEVLHHRGDVREYEAIVFGQTWGFPV